MLATKAMHRAGAVCLAPAAVPARTNVKCLATSSGGGSTTTTSKTTASGGTKKQTKKQFQLKSPQQRKDRFSELPLDYPEYGFFPACPFIPQDDAVLERNKEIEVIHGRWAMLAVTGAWAQEVAGKGPWFNAGAICTPTDCSGIAFPGPFSGSQYALVPESYGDGLPNFWVILGIEVVFLGLAEAYRTGIIAPVFPEFDNDRGNPYPGGRFDPLGFASVRGTRASSTDEFSLDTLKTQELKHSRLAMLAWLGIIAQAVGTNIDAINDGSKAINGPVANLMYHLESPYNHTIFGVLGDAYSKMH